jgi:hypothetical protein
MTQLGVGSMGNLTQNANLAGNLSNVPFSSIIGGAFTACTDAQIQSSVSCTNWIKSVGFRKNNGKDLGEPVMVNFMYDRPGGMMGLNNQKNVVSVPFLALVPIPSLRIESLKIQFNVRLTQTVSNEVSFSGTTTGIGSSDSSKKTSSSTNTIDQNAEDSNYASRVKGEESKAEWSTSTSMFGMVTDQSQNKHGLAISREYSMKVTVSAVQDAIPAGTQRVIDILASLIEKKTGDVGMNELMNSAFQVPGGAGVGGATPAAAPAAV